MVFPALTKAGIPKVRLELPAILARDQQKTAKVFIFQGLRWKFKQRMPITSKSLKLKGVIQHYAVKLPKSAGARHYCPKIPRVPGTLGTRANSSPVY